MPEKLIFKNRGIEFYQNLGTVTLSDTYCRMMEHVGKTESIPEDMKKEIEVVKEAIMDKPFTEKAKYFGNLVNHWKNYYKIFFLAYEKGSDINPLFPSQPFP